MVGDGVVGEGAKGNGARSVDGGVLVYGGLHGRSVERFTIGIWSALRSVRAGVVGGYVERFTVGLECFTLGMWCASRSVRAIVLGGYVEGLPVSMWSASRSGCGQRGEMLGNCPSVGCHGSWHCRGCGGIGLGFVGSAIGNRMVKQI